MKLMHSDIVPPEIFNQQRPLSLSLSVIFNYDLVFFFPFLKRVLGKINNFLLTIVAVKICVKLSR